MAVPIETSPSLRSDKFVTVTSRYSPSQVIYYGDSKKITFTTYKKKEIIESPTDRVAIITPGMEYRPDLVSKATYGTPDFWWRILEVNNISDIFNFKAGKVIKLPASIFA